MAAAGIQAGAAVASTVADFIRGQQQLGIQQQAIDDARRNQAMQTYLTQRGMDQQYRLSTAGQTDAYGNRVVYDPTTNTWVTATSPQGQALINRSDAIQRQFDIANLTTGQDERSMALGRRLAAGEGANALMSQFARGYGAPTKEGVVGAQKVAAATGAGESADIARGGITAAALRSGGSLTSADQALTGVDRGGATGLRTALAQDYSPLYEEMRSNWTANRLNPAGTLTQAAQPGDIPYTPSQLPTTLGSDVINRATRAPATAWNPYTGYTLNAANQSLVGALQKTQLPPTGANIGALGTSLSNLYNSIWPGTKPNEGDVADAYGGGYNVTRSF